MKGAVAKLLGSTVISQAVLSASNFFVASFLLRHLGAEPYGFYVLVTTGIILFVSMQGAFFLTPTLVILPTSDLHQRQRYVGGLMRSRRLAAFTLAALVVVAATGAWLLGVLAPELFLLILAGACAGSAALLREFVRGMLLSYQLGGKALRGDLAYAVLLVIGAVVAVQMPEPAVMAVASLGAAAFISSGVLAFYLWRHEPWERSAPEKVMKRIASDGGWSMVGSMVHWSFSQGYTYLVAALLDVKAVAALAATRLLLMPLNLLSSGISQSMYPLVSRWHFADGLRGALRRVVKIGVILVAAGVGYVLAAWLGRDLFFDVILKKKFDGQDGLILLWSMLFILMLVRDQLSYVLIVRSRMRVLSYITMVSAVTALTMVWFLVPHVGPKGALAGIIAGEVMNMAGMLILLAFELRRG